jgi:hypothetical protein
VEEQREPTEWEKLSEQSMRAILEREVASFLSGAVLTARMVQALAKNTILPREAAVIQFILDRKLEKDAEAAMVAQHEYERFLLDLPPIPAGQVIEMLVKFYERLSYAFEERGIAV